MAAKIAQAQTRRAAAEAVLADAERVRAEAKRDAAVVQRLSKAVPKDDDVGALIRQLDAIARANKIDFRAMKLVSSAAPAPASRPPRRKAEAAEGEGEGEKPAGEKPAGEKAAEGTEAAASTAPVAATVAQPPPGRRRRPRRPADRAVLLHVRRRLPRDAALPRRDRRPREERQGPHHGARTPHHGGRVLAGGRSRRVPEGQGARQRDGLPGARRSRAAATVARRRLPAPARRTRWQALPPPEEPPDERASLEPLRQIVRDLIEKRLWPVAVVLLVALVAAPMLIGGSGGDAPLRAPSPRPSPARRPPRRRPSPTRRRPRSSPHAPSAARPGKFDDPFFDPPTPKAEGAGARRCDGRCRGQHARRSEVADGRGRAAPGHDRGEDDALRRRTRMRPRTADATTTPATPASTRDARARDADRDRDARDARGDAPAERPVNRAQVPAHRRARQRQRRRLAAPDGAAHPDRRRRNPAALFLGVTNAGARYAVFALARERHVARGRDLQARDELPDDRAEGRPDPGRHRAPQRRRRAALQPARALDQGGLGQRRPRPAPRAPTSTTTAAGRCSPCAAGP